jgi:hypothetical protein
VNPGQARVPGEMVRYVRKGVKREFGASLVVLGIEVETTVDLETCEAALDRFEAVRTLLWEIGLADDPQQPDFEFDLLGRWGMLVLKSLESVHAAELMRLQDAATDGIDLPQRDIEALGSLIADLRSKIDPASRSTRWSRFAWRTRETREARRRPGDG